MPQKKKNVIRRFISIPFRNEEERDLLDLAAEADEKSLGEFLRTAMYDRIKTMPELKAHGLRVFARARRAAGCDGHAENSVQKG